MDRPTTVEGWDYVKCATDTGPTGNVDELLGETHTHPMHNAHKYLWRSDATLPFVCGIWHG